MNRADREIGAVVARSIAGGRSRTLKVALPPNAAAPARAIRIVVASDQPILRDGLRRLLEGQSDFRIVGEARSRDDAIDAAHKLNPDVMLLDFTQAAESRLEVMRELKLARLRTRTIVVMSDADRGDLIELLQLGGRGVVMRGTPTELLFKSIRRVHHGEVWISRETAAHVVELLAARAFSLATSQPHENEPIRVFSLTPREREILKLVANGESNKGVAKRLSIGEDTVKHHLTSMFNKTGTSNRLELALFAFDHRLVVRD